MPTSTSTTKVWYYTWVLKHWQPSLRMRWWILLNKFPKEQSKRPKNTLIALLTYEHNDIQLNKDFAGQLGNIWSGRYGHYTRIPLSCLIWNCCAGEFYQQSAWNCNRGGLFQWVLCSILQPKCVGGFKQLFLGNGCQPACWQRYKTLCCFLAFNSSFPLWCTQHGIHAKDL